MSSYYHSKGAIVSTVVGGLGPDRPLPRLASSRCACGHTGDGEEGQHAGKDGLGACLYRGCPCVRFWPPLSEREDASVMPR